MPRAVPLPIATAAFADLEDALALARRERDRALGRIGALIPHDEVRRMLLDAAGTGFSPPQGR
ncbi:hypothetical protein ABZ901_26105 [Actinacidiphila alni]|uniref:hypothetical protein n=1 Tax=Actinacidiphila alni TaxID=380248 RepID=UPI0033DEA690